MRMFLVALTMLSILASANEALKIAGWKETKGITEQEAVLLAREAIHQDIGVDEDGQVCGVEEMWSWEREKDLKPDYPQERGDIFAITGYARGPHREMACAAVQTYDCRVVFNRPEENDPWKVEYTECEPSSPGKQD